MYTIQNNTRYYPSNSPIVSDDASGSGLDFVSMFKMYKLTILRMLVLIILLISIYLFYKMCMKK